MKRNVSVVRFRFLCNVLIIGKVIKEMPGSAASGTHYTYIHTHSLSQLIHFMEQSPS